MDLLIDHGVILKRRTGLMEASAVSRMGPTQNGPRGVYSTGKALVIITHVLNDPVDYCFGEYLSHGELGCPSLPPVVKCII